MATTNPFDLLGDNDNDDPSVLLAAQEQKVVPKKTLAPAQSNAQQKPPPPAKLPAKPLPPAQAVKESRNDGAGRGGRGAGRGYGRGRGSGFSRDYSNNENAFNGVSGGFGAAEDADVTKQSGGTRSYGDRPRGAYRGGGRRGGFSNGEAGEGERPRRQFERRSGTGRGNEFKREGSGRGNWGTSTDEITPEPEEVAIEKNISPEKQPGDEDVAGGNKENNANEAEEKEPEDKEMTLEEYQKVLEEKRKALQALKTEERKVTVDKEFESMQQLTNKKGNDDVFIKLGSDKDKRKEIADKEERAKKSVSINEFLKPADGESYYGGRGRGRGGRGYRGGYAGGNMHNVPAPSIEDPGQFPTLGAK